MTDPYLLTGIAELVTNDPAREGTAGPVPDASVVIQGEAVAWAGPAAEVPTEWSGARPIELDGRAVLPGFVDAHTHLVFVGDRSDEFTRRMGGESYQELAAAGGGILATVDATRSAAFDELVRSTRVRLERMLAGGTTTIEVKSGYGLDTSTEVRMLQAAAAAAGTLPITLRRTFLGAHSVPSDFGSRPDDYVDLVVDEMMPAAAPHADYCDVFVEAGVFDVIQARRVFAAGAAHGLGARVHAEQLSHGGGAALAAEMGAASADHLDHATEDDAARLAAAGTAAVLVPGASFQLRGPQAPGPMLWEHGVTVALATDCNPGTSFIESMPFVVALAVVQMGLSGEQAVWAATRGGALSLGLDDRGWVVPGARADLVILDAPSHRHVAYRPASPLVSGVIVAGRAWMEGPLPSDLTVDEE